MPPRWLSGGGAARPDYYLSSTVLFPFRRIRGCAVVVFVFSKSICVCVCVRVSPLIGTPPISARQRQRIVVTVNSSSVRLCTIFPFNLCCKAQNHHLNHTKSDKNDNNSRPRLDTLEVSVVQHGLTNTNTRCMYNILYRYTGWFMCWFLQNIF